MRSPRSIRSIFTPGAVTLATVLGALSIGCGSSAGGNDSVSSASIVSSANVVMGVRPSPVVDVRRSLAITELPILTNFSMQRVFDQLVSTSGIPGQTSLALFQQWWDTQNPGPGLGLGPHCDDTSNAYGPTLNGYPYTCRATPAEGIEASCDPFAANSACAYIPVGLFMRFDLAPESGKNCGEYRIVYAKANGRTVSGDRNIVIFEAALPNPHIEQGIRGCEKFVRAWAELSDEPSLDKRRIQLEEFYFTGYKEFEPVISYAHFGENSDGVGQVRTNQFVQPSSPRIWSLREFKLKTRCNDGTCRATFVPVTNKVNPYGPLFDATSTEPNAPLFQADFPNQVARLAAASLDGIGMNTADVYNTGQSQANGTTENNYVVNFGGYATNFRSALQTALTTEGSTLTPDEIVARAQAMSCAGCHRLSNNAALGGGLTWPASLGFTHVSERDVDLETVDGVTRYLISQALANNFLPHRKALVEGFLNNLPRPARAPDEPLGGRRTH
ncbi:MAG: hypothetical protein ACOY0T_31850 [Myxococcota bacterium]